MTSADRARNAAPARQNTTCTGIAPATSPARPGNRRGRRRDTPLARPYRCADARGAGRLADGIPRIGAPGMDVEPAPTPEAVTIA
jgi:hypothetical protein